MTDEYAKTLVIHDESYKPGQVYPTQIDEPGNKEKPEAFEERPVPMDYPAYEDSSWLT